MQIAYGMDTFYTENETNSMQSKPRVKPSNSYARSCSFRSRGSYKLLFHREID